ncbi:MAG: integrase core domain-containing protein, partial [Actinobacteria bacterium]|nr:integrase core domain-containing protein [Actinomycetota bacterium]
MTSSPTRPPTGRALRLLNVVDEFTREALATDCERSITAQDTVTCLERLVAERGRTPEHIRCDNGPELTAHALRDWCRSTEARTAYIEPGSPWQNPYVESFNARVRDEVLDLELFATLDEAKLILGDWRADYNTGHPHSALGMLSPVRFAARWREQDTLDTPRDAPLRSPSRLAPRGVGARRNGRSCDLRAAAPFSQTGPPMVAPGRTGRRVVQMQGRLPSAVAEVLRGSRGHIVH